MVKTRKEQVGYKGGHYETSLDSTDVKNSEESSIRNYRREQQQIWAWKNMSNSREGCTESSIAVTL